MTWFQYTLLGLLFFAESSKSSAASLNPVRKVINLLQEIRKEVEKEAEEDVDASKKYKCWCEDNDKEKTDAIAFANARLEEKKTLVQTSRAEQVRLKAEIKFVSKDLKEDENSLASADAQRQKEREAYLEEERDAKSTLESVEKALKVLGNPGLLQEKGRAQAQEARAARVALLHVHHAVEQHAERFQGIMQRDLFEVLGSLEDAERTLGTGSNRAFLSPRPSFTQTAETASYDPSATYTSSSGEIVGMLKNMHWRMMADMADAKKTENEAQEEFAKLRTAKSAEIKAAQKQLRRKKSAVAEIREQLAALSNEISNLGKALEADQTFLVQLRADCKEEAADFVERASARDEEVKAIGETIDILMDDSARAHLESTMGFLQVDQRTHAPLSQERSRRASHFLTQALRHHSSLSLLSINMHVHLDGFTKVKDMMKKASRDLKMEEQRDDEKLESCKAELDETQDNLMDAKAKEERLQRKNKLAKNELEELSSDLSKLKGDISASEESLQKAGLTRQHENKLFQVTMADAETTVKILRKAEKRLKDFYATSLVQTKEHRSGSAAAPPVGSDAPKKTKDYQKSATGGIVVQVLAKVVADADVSATRIRESEKRAQLSYSLFVSDTTASINTARIAVQETEAQLAKVMARKADVAGALTAAQSEGSKVENLLKAQHQDCDWLLEHYDERKKARRDELYAIRDAKDALNGAK
eukprot:TRINITY_DN20942_c0_g1_i1.p1 TRINITY_DN20942_c0_g1~~TRINITY_DN20942_c0_g1_i1.p1  ORF type:complete len:706 (+),score=186.83 TRINITY_DN20942_c0_g1_i1:49-2166(+)